MDRIGSQLAELISMPSVTGSETEIRDHLAARLEARGLEVDGFDADVESIQADDAFPGFEVDHATLPVVLARLNPGARGPHPLLSGHVDVVPPGDADAWESDPFEARFDDGVVYGRGACDMKGGVVAILEVVDRLLERGHTGPVSVAFVPAEEDGGSGTLAAIRRGVSADAVVITEPTRLEIVTAHAGAITFRMTIPGIAAHAATRTEGVSALDALDTIRAALGADEVERNREHSDGRMRDMGLAYPTIIGTIHGGSWASTVIDSLVIEGRYGVRLGQTSHDAERELRACIERAWSTDSFLAGRNLDLEISGARFDPCQIPSDHPLPAGLARAHSVVTGAAPELVGAPYGADMRLFINTAEIPAVMYGPGDVRHAHAANEHVSLADIDTCASVLTEWVSQLEADESH